MTNLFKTEAVRVDEKTALVYWKSDDKKGIFKVNLMQDSEDVEIMSELIVINELIDKLNIKTGIDKKISISKGAVKKLFLRKIIRKDLSPYMAFFEVRLHGVSIFVDKKRFIKEEFENIAVEILDDSKGKYRYKKEVVQLKNIGLVAITKHSLEAYISKTKEGGSSKEPLKSLVSGLNQEELCRRKISKKVLKHKEKKYGTSKNIEVWGSYRFDLSYLFLKEYGRRRLVTVFEIDQTIY